MVLLLFLYGGLSPLKLFIKKLSLSNGYHAVMSQETGRELGIRGIGAQVHPKCYWNPQLHVFYLLLCLAKIYFSLWPLIFCFTISLKYIKSIMIFHSEKRCIKKLLIACMMLSNSLNYCNKAAAPSCAGTAEKLYCNRRQLQNIHLWSEWLLNTVCVF